MSKSKLGRNPLAAKKISAASSGTAARPKATPPHRTVNAQPSLPGFLSHLATAAVAETVLLGLRVVLLARTTFFSRRAH